MAGTLCSTFAGLTLGYPRASCSFKASARPGIMLVPEGSGRMLVRVSAQNSLRRQRTSEKARIRNRSRKSEAKTRLRKALIAVETAGLQLPKAESELEEVDDLMGEAYKAIDKAVSKGALHRNTAARRKSRLAKARQGVLSAAGLYNPESEASLSTELPGLDEDESKEEPPSPSTDEDDDVVVPKNTAVTASN